MKMKFSSIIITLTIIGATLPAMATDQNSSPRAAEKWCSSHPDARESGADDENMIAYMIAQSVTAAHLSCATIVSNGWPHIYQILLRTTF
jgi:hypothetical protein